MIRQIANLCMGRIKSIDGAPSFQEALDLLRGLNENVWVNVHYQKEGGLYEGSNITFRGAAPGDMLDFIKNKFEKVGMIYTDIEHQVYRSIRAEKHYLDFAQGFIEGKYGKAIVKCSPFRKASINYVVSRRNEK